MGDLVCNHIKNIFRDPQIIKQYNDIALVLIPKVEMPEEVLQFRPISLCNVTYKGYKFWQIGYFIAWISSSLTINVVLC